MAGQEPPVVLVTGASGLLGSNLLLSAHRRRYDVVGAYHHARVSASWLRSRSISEQDPASGPDLIRQTRPRWVVHCAAATDVDWCERNPEAAHRINASFTSGLAAASREVDASFVFISTDAVFDGRRGGYSESDAPSPVNVYGASKLAGEAAARNETDDLLIVRTNIFGWNSQSRLSLAEWMLARLEADQTVPGFIDVTFSPILVNQLAETIFDLLEIGVRELIHVGSSDSCTKHRFAQLLAETFGMRTDRVEKSLVECAGLHAPRPRNTALDSTRAASRLGRALPTVRAGLARMRALREQGYRKLLKDLGDNDHDDH